MSNCLARIATLVALLGTGTPGLAEICKWVDDAGVVHYAEECPAGVAGSAVHTPPPPTAAEIEAARQRSEALRSGRSPRASEAEPGAAGQAATAVLTEPAVSCDEAFRTQEILALQLPVYYDDRRRLHYRDSLHHHWYQGPRIYLDDEAREWQFERTRAQIAAQCAGARPSRPAFSARFLNAPTLQETIDLLRDAAGPASPPLSDLCRYADMLDRELAGHAGGVPPDDLRRLQDLRGRHCR